MGFNLDDSLLTILEEGAGAPGGLDASRFCCGLFQEGLLSTYSVVGL